MLDGGTDEAVQHGLDWLVMGYAGLSMDFSFFFFCFSYLINRGGQQTASTKVILTITFDLMRL